MKQLTEVVLVMLYNLTLIAGASYLYVVHGVSGWIFLVPLIFAASWSTKKKDEATDKVS